MLSIGKVGGGDGDPRYYIDNVARGKEDYYSGRGEAQGVWLSSAAERDGLRGEVGDDAFLALLSPETERPRKVLAYDLTFSAPKLVSVLFGLGDRTVAPVVRDVHDQTVADALVYIERHAVWTRRGQGGHRVPHGDGVKVAAFSIAARGPAIRSCTCTQRRTVDITTSAGDHRQVESSYLDEGWLQHGYALTAHAAQGATLDRTFILGSDELYREWGYTAFSRHRDQAR